LAPFGDIETFIFALYSVVDFPYPGQRFDFAFPIRLFGLCLFYRLPSHPIPVL